MTFTISISTMFIAAYVAIAVGLFFFVWFHAALGGVRNPIWEAFRFGLFWPISIIWFFVHFR